MKRFALSLAVFSLFLCGRMFGATAPYGSVLELHSCELYAGGCIVSSEATLGGRYMLRAWHFSGGSFHGAELAGLNLVVLQSSSDNLAAPEANPGSAIVYLPGNSTAGQRDALVAWLKSSQPDLRSFANFQMRNVPTQISKTE